MCLVGWDEMVRAQDGVVCMHGFSEEHELTCTYTYAYTYTYTYTYTLHARRLGGARADLYMRWACACTWSCACAVSMCTCDEHVHMW